MARRDCGNAGKVEEDTDAAIVSRSESGEDNPQAGPNISILLRLQSSKPTKRRRANTTSPRKQRKFDEEAIAEVEDALGADEGRPNYFIAIYINCIGGSKVRWASKLE